MNKQNKILLGILAFVVACTIGYALFSETITINGTATAKGDFEITSTCTPGLTQGVSAPYYSKGQGGYINDSCTVEGDNVTFTTDLLYPTAERLFTIKMTNTGSIDALLNFSDDNTVSSNVTIYNEDGSVYKDNVTLSSDYLTQPEIGALESSDGTLYNSETLNNDAALANHYISTDGMLVLEPNESVYFVAMVQYEENTDQENPNNILKRSIKETTVFNYQWKQPTAK